MRAAIALLAALTLTVPMSAEEPVPLGDAVLVNQWTTSSQWEPRIDLTPDGRGVVTWWGFTFGAGQDGDGTWVSARRLDAGGAPTGAEQVVNLYTPDDQANSDVAIADDGSFVVVWRTTGQYDLFDVMARRYDSTGVPLSGELLVNTYTTSGQNQPAVDGTPDGGFVVVWSSLTEDRIHARRYSSAGTPQGALIEVGPHAERPAISVAGSGDFVVAWEDDDGDQSGVWARRFSSSGGALGGAFQVSSITAGSGYEADVEHRPDGGFVVAWTAFGAPDGDPDRSVRARRFAADGSPLGDDLQVNTGTAGYQYRSHLTVADNGDFVVVWEDAVYPSLGGRRGDPRYESIRGQLFRATGAPVGGELAIDPPSLERGVAFADVAATGNGRFAVTWSSYAAPGDDGGMGVLLRWYANQHLFSDDLETGSAGMWSATGP